MMTGSIDEQIEGPIHRLTAGQVVRVMGENGRICVVWELAVHLPPADPLKESVAISVLLELEDARRLAERTLEFATDDREDWN